MGSNKNQGTTDKLLTQRASEQMGQDSKMYHGNKRTGPTKKAGLLTHLLSEHLLTQTSNCLPPSLVVPVGEEKTFHPN